MFLQDTQTSSITIDIKKPTHLMIVHDGDMQGIFHVVKALAIECERGLFVSQPKGMADIIMKGLTSTESGVDLSKVSFARPSARSEMIPDIISKNLIGVLPITEVLLDDVSSSESDTHDAISQFIELLRHEEHTELPSFIIMNGILPVDLATINGMARATGVFCLTVVHQKALLNSAPSKEFDILKANHQTVLNSSGIYSAQAGEGRLHVEYSQYA